MDAATLSTKANAGYAKAASILGFAAQQYRPTQAINPLAAPIGTLNAAFDQAPGFAFQKPWNRQKAEGYLLGDTSGLAVGDYLVAVRQQEILINGQSLTLNGSALTVGGTGQTTLTNNGQVLTINGLPLTASQGASAAITDGDQDITIGGVALTIGQNPDLPLPSAACDVYFVERLESFRPAEVVFCNVVLSFSRPAEQAQPGPGVYGGRTQSTDTVLATGWPASLLFKGRGETPSARIPSDTRVGAFEVLVPMIPGVVFEEGDRIQDAVGNNYVIFGSEQGPFGQRLLVGVAST